MLNFLKRKPDTRRRGIIQTTAFGSGFFNRDVRYEIVIEVREIETALDMTHIEIENMSGNDGIDISVPEWVETKRIKWIDKGTNDI